MGTTVIWLRCRSILICLSVTWFAHQIGADNDDNNDDGEEEPPSELGIQNENGDDEQEAKKLPPSTETDIVQATYRHRDNRRE